MSVSAGGRGFRLTMHHRNRLLEGLARAEVGGRIPVVFMPIAPGRDIHSIGPWPEHGIEPSRLGPNKNGKHW